MLVTRGDKRRNAMAKHTRDAGSGKYVKSDDAKKRPKEVVVETDKPKNKPAPKK